MSNLDEELERILGQEEQIKIDLSRENAFVEDIDRTILKLRQQIFELQEKRRNQQQNVTVVSGQLRRVANKRYEVEQQVEVEKKAQQDEANLLLKFKTYDEIARNEPWIKGNVHGDRAFKHQVDGAYLLANSGRAILADSVGLGKTLTSVAWMKLRGTKRGIIVCPGETMSQFEQEIKKWSSRPPIVIGRKPKKDVRIILNMLREHNIPEWILIVNYESWARDKALLDEFTFMCADTLICDEAHKIKETTTSAYKGVEKIALSRNQCGECGAFYLECSHNVSIADRSIKSVLMMTGTPILNRPQEIWPLLHIIDSKNFDNKNAFLRNYCTLDYGYNKYVFRDGGMASLAARLRGMYLRRTRDQAGIVLPKQEIQFHNIELDPAEHAMQLELLEHLHQHAQIQITEDKTAGFMSILALITRQRQAATWPGGMEIKVPILNQMGMPVEDEEGNPTYETYIIPEKYWQSAKMDAAVEFCRELVEDGQRVVVFSQFLKALQEFDNRIKMHERNGGSDKIRSVVYAGPTPNDLRDEIKRNLDRTNHEESKWDVVCAHYKIGGQGLNFTAATQIIVLDEEWNPGMNEQSYGRIDRLGQTEETTVHVFRTLETVDEWMASLIQIKKDMLGGWNAANDDVQSALVDMLKRKRGNSPYLELVK